MQKKEKTTATPTLKASELRIGNLIEYYVFDEFGKPQEEWVANYVDIEDLKWLNEHEGDENYRPMKLTEELLVRLGFEKRDGLFRMSGYWVEFRYFDSCKCVKILFGCFQWTHKIYILQTATHIDYTHQLQNLYFALTGEDLKL